MKKRFLLTAISIILICAMLLPVAAASQNGALPTLNISTFDAETALPESAASPVMMLGDDLSSYVSPYLPDGVRDQGQHGTCWVFSSAALAESSLIMQGKADKDIDLSEAQLIYNIYNEVADPLGNTTGDTTEAVADSWLELGGNVMMTSLSLAAWKGIATETEIPYEGISDDMYLTPEQQALSSAILTDSRWFNMSQTAVVKQNIIEYGAVSSSYYHDDTYLNDTTGGYYQNVTTATNHAITIVGWDDNFSASNFANKPAGNGAWLCRNSWGDWWGLDGYFYLSYYDPSLTSQQAYSLKMGTSDIYDNNYQYDGGLQTASIGLPSGLSVWNTFTSSASEKETLEAVGLGTFSTDIKYTLRICDKDGNDLLPEPQIGYTTHAGYYTIELDAPVTLEKGTEFSVCFTLENANGSNDTIQVLIDMAGNNGHFGYTINTENDRSYYGYGVDVFGINLSESENVTLRIKALTNNAKENHDHFITVNGEKTEHREGDIFDIIADFYKYINGMLYRFSYWKCDCDIHDPFDDDQMCNTTVTMPGHDVEINAVYSLLGDLNEDDSVNIQDLFELKSMMLGTVDTTSLGDIAHNHSVDITDLFALKQLLMGEFTPAN